MKNTVLFLLFAAFALISCKTEVKKQHQYDEDIEVRDPEFITKKEKILTTAEAIANANGFQNWGNVKEIQFTFNIDKDTLHFERSWNWNPKNNLVTLTSSRDTITYNRTKMDSIALKVDPEFVNDKYWLLAPYNLVWDADSFTSTHHIKAIAPMSNEEMQKLTIVYQNEGGYTPGDAYDFYFEGDFIIKEWVFREKNTEKPSLITSWENYDDYNGIKIAKTHKRDQGDWKLYFTDIKVITE